MAHPGNVIFKLKRDELLNHDKTWRNLKSILLIERSQSEKAIHYMIPTIWHFVKGKTVEKITRSVVGGMRRWEVEG